MDIDERIKRIEKQLRLAGCPRPANDAITSYLLSGVKTDVSSAHASLAFANSPDRDGFIILINGVQLDEFDLRLLDVCWDLDLTRPFIVQVAYDHRVLQAYARIEHYVASIGSPYLHTLDYFVGLCDHFIHNGAPTPLGRLILDNLHKILRNRSTLQEAHYAAFVRLLLADMPPRTTEAFDLIQQVPARYLDRHVVEPLANADFDRAHPLLLRFVHDGQNDIVLKSLETLLKHLGSHHLSADTVTFFAGEPGVITIEESGSPTTISVPVPQSDMAVDLVAQLLKHKLQYYRQAGLYLLWQADTTSARSIVQQHLEQYPDDGVEDGTLELLAELLGFA